jgi:deoxycytidine triphosphate deaminase
MTTNPASLDFAVSDEEAANRFQLYQHDDPFCDFIPPALLNSADIYDYVRVTGMIFPFERDREKLKREEKLKGASFEIDFLGDVYRFADGKPALEMETIKKDTVFVLKKNSIVFVYLDTVFRLPHYMAIRFNLRITHVHRGLLLGTGPLVDPGFIGRLLIPLHNLTAEDYTLIGGEGLIWAEFTKLSPPKENDERIRNSKRELFTIPERKIKMYAQAYFNRASAGVPARSSIPEEVEKAKALAEDTAAKVRRYTWGAIITGALTILALTGSTWSLISDANRNVADSIKNVAESRNTLEQVNKKLEDIDTRLGKVEASLKKK